MNGRGRGTVSTRAILATVGLLLAQTARAELIDIVNDIRSTGCARRAPAETRVASDAALDAAARLIARGGELDAALAQAGYRATSATSINIGGAVGDDAIREVLEDGFCDKVNNDAYTAVGTYVRGNELWLVLAARFTAPGEGDLQAVAERVLVLVNDARKQDRRCGRQRLRATHALTLSATLMQAAAAHAADMAANGYMGHRGSDGSEAAERVTRAGDGWRAVGENVAAGQPDAETVVTAWLDSPGHCANLMGPQFTEMGVAFVVAPQSDLRILWAQVFAAPR
jgi:uncharacterized protein YkwD